MVRQGCVTGGTSFGVRCFRVAGDVNIPVKQFVSIADMIGSVFDSQGESALNAEENLRTATLAEAPPGLSKRSAWIEHRLSRAVVRGVVEPYYGFRPWKDSAATKQTP